MRLFRASLTLLVALAAFQADAAPAATASEPVPQVTGEADDAPQETPQKAPLAKKRDTIILKNGVILTDVKILSKSPAGYEISVSENVTTTIPRKQVAQIEYEERTPDVEPEPAKLFPGEDLAEDVRAKIMAPLAQPLSTEPQDLLVHLEAVSKATGVPITVDESVKALPETERVWKVDEKQDGSLATLLQEDFLKKFPKLQVNARNGELFIDIKPAAPETAKTEAPPENPATPAS